MADNKTLTIIISIIVAIIVVFSIIGGSAENMRDAADTVTDTNNCSDDTSSDAGGVALAYNFTDKFCYNTSTAGLYAARQYDLPLSDLFGRSGVALLVLMAALLLVVAKTAFKMRKAGK